MERFPARYFDGHSSAVDDVEVRLEGQNVLVIGERVLLTARLDQLRFRPRLGSLPVSIELPDGALLQAEANEVGSVIELPAAAGFAQRLRLDDLHGFYEACKAAGLPEARDGVPRIVPPRKEHWGGTVGFLVDPDGSLLRLVQN